MQGYDNGKDDQQTEGGCSRYLPADAEGKLSESLRAALVDAERDAALQIELNVIEHWLQFFAEPVGQQCCGGFVTGAEYMGQQEQVCCGSPEPDFMSADDLIGAMNKRRTEIVAAMSAQEQGEKSE